METKTQRVVLETPTHRIVGDLTLPREGYLSRVSDYLNQSDLAFISLTNAIIFAGDPRMGAPPVQRKFVAIGTSHIQLAYPEEG